MQTLYIVSKLSIVYANSLFFCQLFISSEILGFHISHFQYIIESSYLLCLVVILIVYSSRQDDRPEIGKK